MNFIHKVALLAFVLSSALGQAATTNAPAAKKETKETKPAKETKTAKAPADGRFLVYVGTYTGPKSKGIYAYRFDSKGGTFTPLGLVAESVNPSFLAIHPGGKYLYSANEVNELNGKPGGAVTAFAIDHATGKLKSLNQASTVGTGPCHLVVDKSGKAVLVANYGGGSVAVLPVKANGSVGEHTAFIQHAGSSVNRSRQKEPHAHSINVSPDNRYAFAADLGLDKVLSYKFDAAKGLLTTNEPAFTAVAPGSGPRHFAFSPDGKHAYVINELLCTLTAFDYDAKKGALTEIQTLSTLPPGVKMKPEYSTAEVVAHPGGGFVYGSNRGHHSIAVFRVDSQTGKLQHVENIPTMGRTPRNFAIDPTGKFLLAESQDSDSITVFRIDAKTGHLTWTGQKLEVPSPVCVRFVREKQ
jgi:6-phosphogluconolactonase